MPMIRKTGLISLLAVNIFACNSSSKQLTYLSSADTGEELTVFVKYRNTETPKVQKYLDSAFKQKSKLGNGKDFQIKLSNGELATVKSTDGNLEIVYNKLKGNTQGIAAMGNIKKDLQKVLFDKVGE